MAEPSKIEDCVMIGKYFQNILLNETEPVSYTIKKKLQNTRRVGWESREIPALSVCYLMFETFQECN